jgi:hypothetical protein
MPGRGAAYFPRPPRRAARHKKAERQQIKILTGCSALASRLATYAQTLQRRACYAIRYRRSLELPCNVLYLQVFFGALAFLQALQALASELDKGQVEIFSTKLSTENQGRAQSLSETSVWHLFLRPAVRSSGKSSKQRTFERRILPCRVARASV